jgi:hypothetical protein
MPAPIVPGPVVPLPMPYNPPLSTTFHPPLPVPPLNTLGL